MSDRAAATVAADVEASLPLTAATFAILLALAGGDRHGYAIMKEVGAHTAGSVVLNPGTLYRIIKQLVADGWIAETDRTSADARRRSYTLTDRGRAVATAEVGRLEELVAIARTRRLAPGPALT